MATKRKWGRYLRGEPNYDNGIRCILPTASCAVRKAIQAADQRHGELRTHDTSHLLVEETLHKKTGGTTTIQFYHPVKLMQYVLDHAPKLACHYSEIATHLGDQCVWKLMLGFEVEREKKKRDAQIEAAEKKAEQKGAAIAALSCKRIQSSIASSEDVSSPRRSKCS